MEYDVNLESFVLETDICNEDDDIIKSFDVAVVDYGVNDNILEIEISVKKTLDEDPDSLDYDYLCWKISGPTWGWDDNAEIRLPEMNVGDVETFTLNIEIDQSGTYELKLKIERD